MLAIANRIHHFSDLMRDYTFLFQRDLDIGSHGYYQQLLRDITYADSKIVAYNEIDALFDLLKYTDTLGLVPRLAFDLYPKKNDYFIIDTYERLLSTEYIVHFDSRKTLNFTAAKMLDYLFSYPGFSPQKTECSL